MRGSRSTATDATDDAFASVTPYEMRLDTRADADRRDLLAEYGAEILEKTASSPLCLNAFGAGCASTADLRAGLPKWLRRRAFSSAAWPACTAPKARCAIAPRPICLAALISCAATGTKTSPDAAAFRRTFCRLSPILWSLPDGCRRTWRQWVRRVARVSARLGNLSGHEAAARDLFHRRRGANEPCR